MNARFVLKSLTLAAAVAFPAAAHAQAPMPAGGFAASISGVRLDPGEGAGQVVPVRAGGDSIALRGALFVVG